MTFKRYVMQTRISAAQNLFLDPLLPVGVVAEKCGFADVAYFAHVFRQNRRLFSYRIPPESPPLSSARASHRSAGSRNRAPESG